MILQVDELLVSWLKTIPEISQRVFHLEVYQNNESTTQYPCICYRRFEDTIEADELEGQNNYSTAMFEIMIFSRNSTPLRAISDAVKKFGRPTFIDSIYTSTCGQVTWIDVNGDGEDNEFAIEQQEKGIKNATLQVAIDYSPDDTL